MTESWRSKNNALKDFGTTASSEQPDGLSEVHYVKANPRKVNTQVAKISYGPPKRYIAPRSKIAQMATHTRNDDMPPPPAAPLTPNTKSTNATTTREDFEKMRSERNVEIQHIQNMLNEITHSPKKTVETEQQNKENIPQTTTHQNDTTSHTFRKSKTELTMSTGTMLRKAATTRRETLRRNTSGDIVRARSSRSQPPPQTKTNEVLPKEAAKPKKTAYNPEEARRFMEEQKRKRRLNAAAMPSLRQDPGKTAFEKEQIKKRLDDLKRNSRQIVKKNLKKKLVPQTEEISTVNTSPKKAPAMEIAFKRPLIDRKRLDQVTIDTDTRTEIALPQKQMEKLSNTQQNDVTSTSNTPRTELEKNIGTDTNALLVNHKRIGLLRKPEIKDHSFSAIKEFSFDKENVAIAMMTPSLTKPIESRIKEKQSLTEEKENVNVVENIENKIAHATVELKKGESTENKEKNLDLNIPSARLKSRNMNAMRETATQVQDSLAESTKEHTADLPYWLKPSAVHVYPYNFIMAVRRKLESIANPIQVPTITNTKKKHSKNFDIQWKKHSETPLTRISRENIAEAQKNVKRRIVTASQAEIIEHDGEQEVEDDKSAESNSFATHTISSGDDPMATNSKAKRSLLLESAELQTPPIADDHLTNSQTQLSELHSNFSSISIPLPASSNTISEISSLKSEAKSEQKYKHSIESLEAHTNDSSDDTTTVSSSVFNSSPSKNQQQSRNQATKPDFLFVAPRPVSPLSLEGIENLKITSKNKNKATTKRAGDETQETEKQASMQEVGANFNQLLHEFNRSLIEVIQVNEQLKSTLDRSHKVISPARKRREEDVRANAALPVEENYTTDFEESSNAAAKKDAATENVQIILEQRRRKLFQLTDAVKPLLTSPPASLLNESSNGDNADDVPAVTATENVDLSNINLNLSNIDKSTTESSESDGSKSGENINELSETSVDRRLLAIERLKVNLRQTIKDAKAARTNDKMTADETIHSNDEIMMSNGNINDSNESASKTLTQTQSDDAAALVSAESVGISDDHSNNNTLKSNTTSTQRTPKAEQTFLINNVATDDANESKSTATNEKSMQSTNDESISEDLQNAHESKSLDNNNGNDKTVTQMQSEMNDNFINSHINNSRGDFISKPLTANELEFEQHVLNTSKADAAARSKQSFVPHENNNNIISSDSSLAPPGYNATHSTAIKRHDAANKTPKTHHRQQQHHQHSSKMQIKATITAASSSSTSSIQLENKSIGSEIAAIFNQSDMEISIFSSHNNHSPFETSLNYSNVGLYEKLIQTETTKSEHLSALLKMREKVLLDRTKGQIAWLEVQKERYKAKGSLMHIATIKKKQRGILMKMEKEREEIKRLLQSTTTTTTTSTTETTKSPAQRKRKNHTTLSPSKTPATAPAALLNSSLLSPTFSRPKAARILLQQEEKQQQRQEQNTSASNTAVSAKVRSCSAPIVRGNYELESSQSLVQLLQKRETDLRKRREHVERLMQWHQRLDQEEAEVEQLERMVLNYNSATAAPQHETPNLSNTQQPGDPKTLEQHLPNITGTTTSSSQKSPKKLSPPSPQRQKRVHSTKMERRLKEIDKSLRELSSISTSAYSNNSNNTNTSSGVDAADANGNMAASDSHADFVRTTGHKLNKLWRRLTSQQIDKFEPNRRYKLCKADLEHLYEEAKVVVLREFSHDEDRITAELLEKSVTSSYAAAASQLCVAENAYNTDNNSSNQVNVPCLNLSLSSEHSEQHDEGEGSIAEEVSLSSPPQGNYSPSAAEEDFNMRTAPQETTTGESQTSASETDAHTVRSDETKHNRNVRKFAKLTQERLLCVQKASRLQRSLSDTQIAELTQSITTHLKYAASQRNITSKHITEHQHNIDSNENVEHGENSAATSATVQTAEADSLDNIESLQTQSTLSYCAADNDFNTDVRSMQEANTNASAKSNVPLAIEQHNDDIAEGNLENEACSTAAEEQDTPTEQNSAATLSEVSAESDNTATSAKATTETTQSNAIIPLPAVASSNDDDAMAATESHSRTLKATYSAQANSEAASDQKAREISAKLEEISTAVSKLSQENSLPTYQSTKISEIPSNNNNSIENSTNNTNNAVTTNSNILSSLVDDVEVNLSGGDASYSCHFENVSTDMCSPSGCTLKSSTKVNETSKTSSTASCNTFSTSKTFVVVVEATNNATSQSETENHLLDNYEADFESAAEETCIEDISLPQFETTIETTQSEEGEEVDGDNDESNKLNFNNLCEEKNCVKELKFFEQVLETTKDNLHLNLSLPPPPPPLPPPPPPISKTTGATPPIFTEQTTITSTITAAIAATNSNNNQTQQQQLMPDIINELEIRRCQQILLDSEHLKQYEQVTAVPYTYMYMREIPNKPPPPYMPPAHGSPMTTIFPSEDRIKDITYRRSHELYCDMLKTDYANEKGEKLPSVMEEKITNIYERIILDICREYLDEHHEVLSQNDPTNFHSQLAFFNPPDRLRCIQESIYKEVRRCLAMDKIAPKRTQVFSVYGQRAKRDHIGKIIIQEMYDEDDKWCNFHREENEVLELILEEMMGNHLTELAKQVLLEEGGCIEAEEGEEEEEEEPSSSAAAAALMECENFEIASILSYTDNSIKSSNEE